MHETERIAGSVSVWSPSGADLRTLINKLRHYQGRVQELFRLAATRSGARCRRAPLRVAANRGSYYWTRPKSRERRWGGAPGVGADHLPRAENLLTS